MKLYLVNLEVEQGEKHDPEALGTLTIAVRAPSPGDALDLAVERTEKLLRDEDETATWIVIEESTVELLDITQPVIVHQVWRPLEQGKEGFLSSECTAPDDDDKGFVVYSTTPEDAVEIVPVLVLNAVEED